MTCSYSFNPFLVKFIETFTKVKVFIVSYKEQLNSNAKFSFISKERREFLPS